MDAIDRYEMAHGIYPVAFDRRWHPGMHLTPRMQNEKIRAIADGEVVAYRVCQHAFDGGGGVRDSNAGFVLLKHTTETGEGRKLTFYSLYMHLLELDGYNDHGVHSDVLPSFLRAPSPGPNMQPPVVAPAQAGGDRRVYRKDILGLTGRCHGQQHLHFEIFMTKPDFDAYFGHSQLGEEQVATPATGDYWGNSYYVIPPQQQFLRLPVGADAHHKLNGIRFDELRAGRNAGTLYVETWFHKGSKFTKVWRDAGAARFELLTAEPIREPDYEYNLYSRASALYPGCPSDGYEMLRFGRVLSAPVTLPEAARTTWMRVAFAAGQEGYVDINNQGILKLSDADFPFFKGWKKIREGGGPFNADGLCDIDALKKILQDAKDHETPQEAAQTEEYQKEDALVRYVKTTEGVREQLRGFVCEAPSEWDSTQNEDRFRKLKDSGEFYDGNDAGYTKFLRLLTSFQFWDHTGLPAGGKLWFFHPTAFIRHFRRCGWLSKNEIAQCIPRKILKLQGRQFVPVTNQWPAAFQQGKAWHIDLNLSMRKYLVASTMQRVTHFLAQLMEESGFLRLVREIGGEQRSYSPYFGRGLIQLTNLPNYEKYGVYRKFPIDNASAASDFHALRWNPNVLIAQDNISFNRANCADSAGLYWVCPVMTAVGKNSLKTSDLGIDVANVVDSSKSTNGNVVNEKINGLECRLQSFIYIKYILLDLIKSDATERLSFVWRRNSEQEPILNPDGTPMLDPHTHRPKKKFYPIVHTIQVSLERQSP
ncbi:M23 family metallopeptidase [Paraburkholderia haematera]|nr:M23 family metallopeptidase [Paraburkholderia haematera]